jgi:hypothetical protein
LGRFCTKHWVASTCYDELERILERMEEESIADMKPIPPPLPDKFISFGQNWRVFSEGFKGHCAVVRGTMIIPLTYVLREHDTVHLNTVLPITILPMKD